MSCIIIFSLTIPSAVRSVLFDWSFMVRKTCTLVRKTTLRTGQTPHRRGGSTFFINFGAPSPFRTTKLVVRLTHGTRCPTSARDVWASNPAVDSPFCLLRMTLILVERHIYNSYVQRKAHNDPSLRPTVFRISSAISRRSLLRSTSSHRCGVDGLHPEHDVT